MLRILHVTGIKIFADGVAEYPSQTAHLSKPYKNTGRNGDLLFDPKKFAELCIAADKQGLDHPRARDWRRRGDGGAGWDCGGAKGEWKFRITGHAYA